MNKDQLEDIMTLYGDDMKRVALLYLRSDADAEEVVQESFLQLYRSYHNFRGDSHIKTYLYRIVMNHCHKWKRKRWLLFWEDWEVAGESFEKDVMVKHDLARGLGVLKPAYREVLILHYYEDYSVKTIARILGKSEANVKTMLSRGRVKLKEVMEGSGYYGKNL